MPHPLSLVSKFGLNLGVTPILVFSKNAIFGNTMAISREPQTKALEVIYQVTKFKTLALVVPNLYAIK